MMRKNAVNYKKHIYGIDISPKFTFSEIINVLKQL